jgi:DNA-binding SARP family transcriptional activator
LVLRYNLLVMAVRELVIQSQLIPPRLRRGVLRRTRLETLLATVLDYPLTIVQAGTGYGKSTALSALSYRVERLAWYTITEPDRDPLLFLAHLVSAFERLEPGWATQVLEIVEASGGQVTVDALTPLLNNLTRKLDRETVLVLDDYHLVDDVPEISALVERLVDYAPPGLHVVLSSRRMPPTEALTRWRVKRQVLRVDRDDLAFTADEIEALFHSEYGYPLSPEQAQALTIETEGWVIALQMLWQSLQADKVQDLDAILDQLPSSLETLFDYLARDVLACQSRPMQRFLITTSVLRQMDAASCDHLLDTSGSLDTLRELHESGLFVISVSDDAYRYQRLFHDFLQGQVGKDIAHAQSLHRRAASHYRLAGKPEETVYHLLEAQEHEQAALLLEEIGPGLVGMGRFDSFSTWVGQLPDQLVSARPGLLLLIGDVSRLRARFDEALDFYASAERLYAIRREQLGRSRALRGQAQVYLDTVRPLKGDSLLEEALRLLEPEEYRQEVAALLDKLAENKLNLGDPDEAQVLHHEAGLLRTETDPGDVFLDARAMVRTGRLAEAQRLLEARAAEEREADHTRPQRFHRETLLLLSLVHALKGNAEEASRHAREGIAVGRDLGSAFVEAVGHMRLGHSVQLWESRPWDTRRGSNMQVAIRYYERAIEQVRTFKVMRTQVEPLWGLCRAYGYNGEIQKAERFAKQALSIIQRAGDEWMHNIVQVTIGAGHVLAGQSGPSCPHLTEAVEGFARVGDPFGQSAAWLWLALDAWQQKDTEGTAVILADLLPLCRKHDYDMLLIRRSFLGLRAARAAIPLLVEAKRKKIEADYVARLLDRAALSNVDYHPGYELAVRTLGPFAVWRGDELVAPGDWKREKARQVFQLLLTYPRQWFYREQIVDHLWPHLPPDAAERDFRVALNALNHALEPTRPRRQSPFFVIRRGSVYGLNPSAVISVDSSDFERLAASDEVEQLRRALQIYEDDYLPGSAYEDWCAAERQRLRHLYLVTAERLARHLVQAESWDQVIDICQAILARDSCWEPAYRLLMRAYNGQNNRPMVQSAYQKCSLTLRNELGVEPAPTTRALFETLRQ